MQEVVHRRGRVLSNVGGEKNWSRKDAFWREKKKALSGWWVEWQGAKEKGGLGTLKGGEPLGTSIQAIQTHP